MSLSTQPREVNIQISAAKVSCAWARISSADGIALGQLELPPLPPFPPFPFPPVLPFPFPFPPVLPFPFPPFPFPFPLPFPLPPSSLPPFPFPFPFPPLPSSPPAPFPLPFPFPPSSGLGRNSAHASMAAGLFSSIADPAAQIIIISS